ncbi:hypothetical protein GPALN_010647 [Globodera pallida]|nr:hypothetical protein GPALN_010647 [Globodera pallida]
MLVGNKSRFATSSSSASGKFVQPDEAKTYVEHNPLPFIKTSALDTTNVGSRRRSQTFPPKFTAPSAPGERE